MSANRKSRLGQAIDWVRDRYFLLASSVLWIVFIALLVGAFVPAVGDWLLSYELAGPALTVGLGLIILDALANARRADEAGDFVGDSVALTEHFGRAGGRKLVRVDFSGDSAETLKILLRETVRRAGDGFHRKPRLEVRIFVPDLRKPIGVPCDVSGNDVPAYRAENWRRTRAALEQIRTEVEDAFAAGQFGGVRLQMRFHPLTPVLKLYVLNEEEAHYGFYGIEKRTRGRHGEVLDTRGTGASVFEVRRNGTRAEREMLNSLRAWFEQAWSGVGQTDEDFPDLELK